jgi:hypothetical protein
MVELFIQNYEYFQKAFMGQGGKPASLSTDMGGYPATM